MIKVENIDVYGFEAAIRGMRNPMNSWHKSDSALCRKDWNDCTVKPACGCPKDGTFDEDYFCIGPNDFDLMKRLFNAGTEHRKYLRMINVTMDIVAPLYWWKEYDTYKVGTVANSCSTMHKIHSQKITEDDFSIDEGLLFYFTNTIVECERLRELYLETKDKRYWRALIQLLPSSYNQRRTVQLNYETVFNIIRQRSGHKLDEWVQFVEQLKELPYVKELME